MMNAAAAVTLILRVFKLKLTVAWLGHSEFKFRASEHRVRVGPGHGPSPCPSHSAGPGLRVTVVVYR